MTAASAFSAASFLPPILAQASNSPSMVKNPTGVHFDEDSTGGGSNSSGQNFQQHSGSTDIIQASLIKMLQQKCSEMAQLADQEVVKRGQAETVAQQTVHTA